MRLQDDQVTTDEVKSWQGVHLLNFHASSCSQKVRIFLAEKNVPFTSHSVNLARKANTEPWFLGINPRGVVPVLVHDGAVHVESNDILEYIDRELPSRSQSYFPSDAEERAHVAESLALEDSLHTALRNLSMAFIFPRRVAMKSPAALKSFEESGEKNAARDKEIAWWRDFAQQGVTDDAIAQSIRGFATAFAGLERRLEERPWFMGDRISVLEVAWFISLHRPVLAGYPLERHRRLYAHYQRLLRRPTFRNEVEPPAPLRMLLEGYRAFRRARGTTMQAFIRHNMNNNIFGGSASHDAARAI